MLIVILLLLRSYEQTFNTSTTLKKAPYKLYIVLHLHLMIINNYRYIVSNKNKLLF